MYKDSEIRALHAEDERSYLGDSHLGLVDYSADLDFQIGVLQQSSKVSVVRKRNAHSKLGERFLQLER